MDFWLGFMSGFLGMFVIAVATHDGEQVQTKKLDELVAKCDEAARNYQAYQEHLTQTLREHGQ